MQVIEFPIGQPKKFLEEVPDKKVAKMGNGSGKPRSRG
jgi:hypothetical protein